MRRKEFVGTLLGGACYLAFSGCSRSGSGNGNSAAVQVQGSDTMVNLIQAWAEAYSIARPEGSIEVGGGGSGVGIAALINGTIDVASASRDMKADERTKAKSVSGDEPREYTIGYDCLAIFVHRNNPLEVITMEQLDAIYSEYGTVTKWSDLGIAVPGCKSDKIIRVSRQSSSGTFEFFRERVLHKKDFKLSSRDMNGSKEVVELVGSTPCGIGYSGMGYANDHVKMVRVMHNGEEVAPSVETAQNKSYPIARPLFLYTLGEPEGPVREFLDWVFSDAGQEIVEETGYVPVPPGQRAKLN